MEKMCGKHHCKGEILREGIGQWLLLTLFTQNVTFPQVLSLCRNQPIDLQSKFADLVSLLIEQCLDTGYCYFWNMLLKSIFQAII